MNQFRYKNLISHIPQVILVILIGGCAMYTGPREGSTAYPPVPPPRPEPLAPVHYEHTVKNETPRTFESTDSSSFRAAYAKRGRPLVTCVFYTSDRTIIMGQSTAPLYHGHETLSIQATKKDSARVNSEIDVQATATSAFSVSTGVRPSKAQLATWSDVQQAVFETLREHGVRVSDPEMTTLSGLDKLVQRLEQDVSLQTAELEAIRKESKNELICLIQNSVSGGSEYLQGRIWDTKTGELVAAQRIFLWSSSDPWLQRHIVDAKARQLVRNLLSQAASSWE